MLLSTENETALCRDDIADVIFSLKKAEAARVVHSCNLISCASRQHGVNNNVCVHGCVGLWLQSWAPACGDLWAALRSARPTSSGGCQSRRKSSSEMGPPLWTAPWSNCRRSMEHWIIYASIININSNSISWIKFKSILLLLECLQ